MSPAGANKRFSASIMETWQNTTLGEVIELKRGYDLPQGQRQPGSVPLVSSSGITDHHVMAAVKGPGVVTGRYGTIGQVFFIEPDFWPLNTTLYVKDFKGNDPKFVSYLLKTVDYLAYSDKAAVPGINRNHLHQARVSIPPVSEQRAIASILGALDDKIDLNRRMNATLEAMARAIFQSWFVDFDPVRAKAEGRETGLPAEIAALFPDGFVESELGEIPKGWTVAPVGDDVQIVKGVSYRSEHLAPSETAMVNLKSIQRGGGYRVDGLKEFTGPYKPEQIVSPYELVVAQTDVTQAAEVIGKPAIVLPDERYRTLVASLDILIIRPRAGDLARYFFYFMFGRPEYQDHIYGHTNGTTVLHLSRNGVSSFRYAKPPAQLGTVYGRIVVPLFERQFQNSREIQILTAARDALLPILISGQLRVPDVPDLI